MICYQIVVEMNIFIIYFKDNSQDNILLHSNILKLVFIYLL